MTALAEHAASLRCPICGGVEGCDHTVLERAMAEHAAGKDAK